jgi:hypothetical protein
MHVQKSGTFYDVYVKNDAYYQKFVDLCSDKNTTLDTSFNDYMNEIQGSISELANVSIGDIEIHVLPESATDKSSGGTVDVSDDIIGMTTSAYYYEADETMGASVLTCKNMIFNITPDKTAATNLLNKIEMIYEDDTKLSATVDRYSDASNYVKDFMSQEVDENGDTVYTLSAQDNPLGFAIATLAGEATGETMKEAMEAQSLSVEGTMEEKLKEWAEEKKKENEKTLLKSSDSSDTHSTTLDELN